MPRKVAHQQIYKPGMFGGVVNTTLCGAVDNKNWGTNDGMNVGNNVTCKNCMKILSGERPAYNLKWVGTTYAEAENHKP